MICVGAFRLNKAASAWNCFGLDSPCQVMRNQRLRWIVPYSPGGVKIKTPGFFILRLYFYRRGSRVSLHSLIPVECKYK